MFNVPTDEAVRHNGGQANTNADAKRRQEHSRHEHAVHHEQQRHATQLSALDDDLEDRTAELLSAKGSNLRRASNKGRAARQLEEAQHRIRRCAALSLLASQACLL